MVENEMQVKNSSNYEETLLEIPSSIFFVPLCLCDCVCNYSPSDLLHCYSNNSHFFHGNWVEDVRPAVTLLICKLWSDVFLSPAEEQLRGCLLSLLSATVVCRLSIVNETSLWPPSLNPEKAFFL